MQFGKTIKYRRTPGGDGPLRLPGRLASGLPDLMWFKAKSDREHARQYSYINRSFAKGLCEISPKPKTCRSDGRSVPRANRIVETSRTRSAPMSL